MTDVSLFWVTFGAYLLGMFLLVVALWRPGLDRLAWAGRAVVWVGLLSQTAGLVWRAFRVGTEPLNRFLPRLGQSLSSGPRWQAAVYALIVAVAALAVVVAVLWRRRRPVWLVTAAVAVIVELILLDFLDFTRLPVEKVYEYLSLASWCAALSLLALSPVLKSVALDAALAVAACVLTVFAAIQPKTMDLQLVPALQSYWLFIHVSLTGLGFAIFGIAFVVAAMFIVRAYDRAAMTRQTRRAAWVAAVAAVGVGVVLTAGALATGRVLPFRTVAYAAHELAAAQEGTPLRVGTIQIVRYASAVLGLVVLWAYVAYWAFLAWVRPRGDRSGFGSYAFVISSVAMLAACLGLAAAVRGQERAIAGLWDQVAELDRLGSRLLADRDALDEAALDDEVERLRSLSRQARRVLTLALWLPLSLDNQADVVGDPAYRLLRDLYERSGNAWRLPIRTRDIKIIGRMLAEQAAAVEAVAARLPLPADREQVLRTRRDLRRQGTRREAAALLPRGKAGMVAAFSGLAALIAVPVGVVLVFLANAARERLPEAARLDRISYMAVAIGYPVFTFGALFAGAIWAHYAWGTWWGWDPKEVGSLVAWALYTLYLHQRLREGLRPRVAAVFAMLGFLAAVLSLAGNTFLGGLHAYS